MKAGFFKIFAAAFFLASSAFGSPVGTLAAPVTSVVPGYEDNVFTDPIGVIQGHYGGMWDGELNGQGTIDILTLPGTPASLYQVYAPAVDPFPQSFGPFQASDVSYSLGPGTPLQPVTSPVPEPAMMPVFVILFVLTAAYCRLSANSRVKI